MSQHLFRSPILPFALFVLPFLSAATPPGTESTDDLIRQANAAFLHGDLDTADPLYATAEERTGDPGLVAFNRAAVLFQRGEFWAAEVHYARTLDDRACPPERAARAWYNRGTCLLRRGGEAGVYRSAATCLERCLDLNPTDESLKADARHNLEIAKILWSEANRKATKPETPNSQSPEDQPDPPQPPPGADSQEPNGNDPGDGTTGPNGSRPARQQSRAPAGAPGSPKETATPSAGNNTGLQVLPDSDKPKPMSPEQSREDLRRAEERFRRERQMRARDLYGPERPGLSDW